MKIDVVFHKIYLALVQKKTNLAYWASREKNSLKEVRTFPCWAVYLFKNNISQVCILFTSSNVRPWIGQAKGEICHMLDGGAANGSVFGGGGLEDDNAAGF